MQPRRKTRAALRRKVVTSFKGARYQLMCFSALDKSISLDQKKMRWPLTRWKTEQLPAGAGRISDVLFQVLKYDIFRDGAVGG
jgi:hypothetical protein